MAWGPPNACRARAVDGGYRLTGRWDFASGCRQARWMAAHCHVLEADGTLLFEQAVRMDLEGIVCKRKDSPYHVTDKPSRHWIKVKNPKYSQLEARQELFEC